MSKMLKSITPMRIRFAGLVVSTITVLTLLASCGQKGPLYMPEDVVTNQSEEPSFSPTQDTATNPSQTRSLPAKPTISETSQQQSSRKKER